MDSAWSVGRWSVTYWQTTLSECITITETAGANSSKWRLGWIIEDISLQGTTSIATGYITFLFKLTLGTTFVDARIWKCAMSFEW